MLEFDRLGFVIDGLGMMDIKSRQMGRVGKYLYPKIEFTMDFQQETALESVEYPTCATYAHV